VKSRMYVVDVCTCVARS